MSAAASGRCKKIKTADRIIEDLGWGKFQWNISLKISSVLITDGLEITIMAVVAPMLRCEWSLSSLQISILSAITFYCATSVLFLGLISSIAPNYFLFLTTRVLFGVFTSNCYQCYNLVLEYSPASYRGKCMLYLGLFWTIGMFLGVLFGAFLLPWTNWRVVIAVANLPTLITLVCLSWNCPESLRYLIITNKQHIAMKIIKEATILNEVPQFDEDVKLYIEIREKGKYSELFNSKYAFTTLMMIISCFTSLAAYYGSVFLQPVMLNQMSKLKHKVSTDCILRCHEFEFMDFLSMLLPTLPEIIGLFVIVYFWDGIGRKKTTAIFNMSAAIFFIGFFISFDSFVVVTVLFAIIRAFLQGSTFGYILYTAELYPTRLRGIAVGLCGSANKMGSVFGPILGQFSDGLEVILMSIVGPVLLCEWRLSYFQLSLLGSSIFIGMTFGTLIIGKLADLYGRRKVIVLTSLGALFYGLQSAFSPNFLFLFISRTLLGAFISNNYQSKCLLYEYSPNKSRAKLSWFLTPTYFDTFKPQPSTHHINTRYKNLCKDASATKAYCDRCVKFAIPKLINYTMKGFSSVNENLYVINQSKDKLTSKPKHIISSIIEKSTWAFGMILGQLLCLVVLIWSGWRTSLLLSTIPTFLAITSFKWLRESIRFYSVTGNKHALVDMVKLMAKENKKSIPIERIVLDNRKERGNYIDLFKSPYLPITLPFFSCVYVSLLWSHFLTTSHDYDVYNAARLLWMTVTFSVIRIFIFCSQTVFLLYVAEGIYMKAPTAAIFTFIGFSIIAGTLFLIVPKETVNTPMVNNKEEIVTSISLN
ncbi:Synaptic vesicle 2-related protein [Nymphon striatum]|nr:Synaptic vesicle 2-related protein [Nymphon striatum]